mgnify:CR=1 FL=1
MSMSTSKIIIISQRGYEMIENKNERDELHRAIWSIADDLRGSVDGWDFKNYVLGIMFYRYISENLTNYINKDEKDAGNDEGRCKFRREGASGQDKDHTYSQLQLY